MKDSEFMELLNLYLDHEIGIADAKLLEAEVQLNPKRRRIYREYCQMQKACVLLSERIVDPAGETPSKVIDFLTPTRVLRWHNYAIGACAAAACVALASVIFNGNGSANVAARSIDPAAIASVQISEGHTKPEGHRELPQTVSLNQKGPVLHPVFIGESFVLGRQMPDSTVSALANQRFEWMNQVQMVSLRRVSPDDLFFEAKSVPNSIENRTFRGRRGPDSQIEQAAFQFSGKAIRDQALTLAKSLPYQ